MSDSEKHRLGKSFIFPKAVMDDIHIKSDLGRYRMRGFSLFKKIPTIPIVKITAPKVR